MKKLIIAALVLSASSVAPAKQEYAAYEGRDAIQVGNGGTKITKNGIDFWTTGSPPHRYQVLGILTDARKNRRFDGNVIGSESVAKKAIAAGGDAVIVAGADTKAAGFVTSGNAFSPATAFT